MKTFYRPSGSVEVRTAVRFPLELDFELQTLQRKYQAVTVDVSANGVLFAAKEVPPVGSSVTFALKMPAAIMGGTEDVLLHCVGRIVRQTKTATRNLAAAVIDEYFLRAE